MAMTPPAAERRRVSPWWSRLHLLVRLIGLTGLLAAYAGLMLLRPSHPDDVLKVVSPPDTTTFAGRVGLLILGGGIAAALALVVEVLVALRFVAGRRSVFGANALVQVALAGVLVVIVNLYSFHHNARFDWTREQSFTLPEEVRAQLARLDPNSETTIVLYQRHRASSTSGDKPDPFDLEAERKVVEKVKDLVELFRSVGPQFKVEVLDVGEKGYGDKLAKLTEDAPELRKAIEEAPENSILIRAGAHVQRMSFNDFYRLDRTASTQRDNLVLRNVGPEPLVSRIVNVEERRPRIGVLTAHEALSSEGPIDVFTLAGARKVLLAHGFDVKDVILRNLNGDPSADSLEVTKLERLQDERDDLDTEIRVGEREIKLLEQLVKELPKGDLKDINRLISVYADQFNPRFVLVRAAESNREVLTRLFNNQLAAAREGLQLAGEARKKVSDEIGEISLDKVSEQRRLRELQSKLSRALTGVDMLFVPRLTLLQTGEPIANPTFHDLEARQARAVRKALRQGKPLLACLGPTNMPAGTGRPGAAATKPPDDLEKALAELGILFGKRTVVYNVEKRAFAGRDENMLRVSKPLEVPPLRLDEAARSLPEQLQQTAFTQVREPVAALGVAAECPLGALAFLRTDEPPHRPNPVAQSLGLADTESGQRLNLKFRFLRPVFIDPLRMRYLSYRPDVLSTSAASWNDEQPFSTAVRPVPRFEAPAPDDPDNGTLEARRRGPFTVGVAVETTLPPDWVAEGGTSGKVRVAALGQAGLFTGPELSPAQERLLVDTCNWLLGRQERLAKPAPEWSYPRLSLSEDEQSVWLWGARQGLPVLFAYLGLVVLLWRRLR